MGLYGPHASALKLTRQRQDSLSKLNRVSALKGYDSSRDGLIKYTSQTPTGTGEAKVGHLMHDDVSKDKVVNQILVTRSNNQFGSNTNANLPQVFLPIHSNLMRKI